MYCYATILNSVLDDFLDDVAETQQCCTELLPILAKHHPSLLVSICALSQACELVVTDFNKR